MRLRDVWLGVFVCLAGCSDAAAHRAELSVAGAASLRQLLEESGADFVTARGGDIALSFTFAGSSTLARQIGAGAAVDVFVSADPLVLSHAGERVRAADARAVLGNRLALVARRGAPVVAGPAALADVSGRVAVAAPAVPAGRYARRLFAEHGVADALAPRLVSADHVRAALALVESGAADYGVVYATDAALARRARTDWTGELGAGPPITYVAVACGEAGPLAEDYLGFVTSEVFRERARALGFLIP